MAIDRKEKLILINGLDRTEEIDSIEVGDEYTSVTFLEEPGNPCAYRSSAVVVITHPDVLDPSLYQVRQDGKTVSGLSCLLRFRRSLFEFYVYEKDGEIRSASSKELEVHASCLSDRKAAECFSYLKELSKLDRTSYEDEPSLRERYSQLDFIDEDSLLAFYLKPEGKTLKKYPERPLIFPYGGNESQFKAVRLALSNQLSVIQGPPGTGKTRTIMNIVANLLAEGKTMLIVSSCNSSVESLWERLEESGLGYLTAFLGSSVNKEYFLQNQPSYPVRQEAAVATNGLRIKDIQARLDKVFSLEEELSKKRQRLRDLEDETRYFEAFCEDNEIQLEEFRGRVKDSDKLFDMLAKLLTIQNNSRVKLFFFRMRCGLPLFLTKKKKPAEIVTLLKDSLYKMRKEGYEEDIAELEEELSGVSSERLLSELEERSKAVLGKALSQRIRKERPVFTEEDLRKNGSGVLKEYPVVLSTTSASASSLQYVKYDYLIMDEASETDVAAGALALSCAANAVIIGDDRQLPDIISTEEQCTELFGRYSLDGRYEMRTGNSFLKSISTLVGEESVTMLREHYRCDPRIITYCNRKFYGGKLIAMTETGKDPIEVIKVKRDPEESDDYSNKRECEVILSEVLPSLYAVDDKDIGIISPYTRQVELIKSRLEDRAVEVSTIDSFHGKEKRVIIFSAVDDQLSPYVDDGEFFNVAVSRAKEKFILVVSDSPQARKGNITDFIDYSEYLEGKLEDGPFYAVFDLLYGRNAEKRRETLHDQLRIKEQDTDDLAMNVILEVLKEQSLGEVRVVSHYPLRELLRHPDKKRLGEKEYSYVTNHLTHLDFLLYKAVSKKPLLAIEVEDRDERGRRQLSKDRLKDSILVSYGLPVLRVSSLDNDFKEKVTEALKAAL